ncbi:MAG: hypothetical protein AB1641_07660 [Thermodesulfobacteriota bacterium]
MNAEVQLTDMEKLDHLLKHWREHNDEHATVFRTWAARAAAAGRGETARLLGLAAEAAGRVSELLDQAGAALE